ncbi:zinc carboxypeptidase [Streptomyces sp. A7024]|uniref:Zinc carboxypeptidase n=1 Tax=Streptomyces coryli TaxID=1128680 RepID=A0A6G4U8C4_9ACTN|nr:M14 family metallopeptidase [Streptomyces coryli]NGN67638.1 zinc carboxypeptidase [Streptomyces coryli]
MRRRASAVLTAAALLAGGLLAAPPVQAKGPGADPAAADAIKVFRAEVTKEQVPLLLKAGQDGHELAERAPQKGTADVELYLTDKQADRLRGQGIEMREHEVSAAAQKKLAAAGDGVFRPYGGKGGLKEEIVKTGQAHDKLTKVVSIGKTVKGQDILALKVSKNADRARDGSKPSTLYLSNQHAREWITPEMTRRMMHHYLDNYGKDPRITKIVDSTELWFVLSANPDGYDFTHATDGNRQWRKNMRDNDKDGTHTAADGVDLNRNFAYKWGYDNEGSSPDFSSETYRGTTPMSEPETAAMDRFQKRIGFTYGINYHSAAQLLLYGVGWQVATPSPDDVLYRALAGTPENSAVPGYRPQISSELYTTNGDTDGHAANVNGAAMFTPEMSTCQTISNLDPNDPWKPEDCASVFTFPDDEKLIQDEFTKNIPFALAVAETAMHPDQPSSPVGIDAPDFTADTFATSYARGADQEVSVTARKSVRDKELNYRINGGRTHDEDLDSWRGGERFGGEDNLYFDEYREKVEDAGPGDKVEVWYTGRTQKGERVSSEHFTYTVAERPRASTLVVAEEGAAQKHAQKYVDALKANGRSAVVWDVATQGAPHPLAVLAHFSTVVHYTGDPAPGGPTTLAIRAYLNEGGKVVVAGERAGGNVRLGRANSNDFAQYYLGAYERLTAPGATTFDGDGALGGVDTPVTGAEGNPLDSAGRYTVTSDTLPADEFPQFRSAQAGSYPGVANPYAPYEGAGMASSVHADSDWQRLTRTIDLTGVSAADAPELRLAANWNVEPGYDHALLEARTDGGDDWTTLADKNGNTSQTVPEECGAGFFMEDHPFLSRYLTRSGSTCTASGTSGAWNSLTDASDGWKPLAFDLSAYAGKKVEVSLSKVTDPSSGLRGVFADNAQVVVGGEVKETEGFETSLGAWKVSPQPPGSANITGDWSRTGELYKPYAAVTTRDSVLIGFGLEHIPSQPARNQLMGKALAALSR